MAFKQLSLIIFLSVLVVLSCSKFAQKYQWDFSQNKLASLSPDTLELLKQLDAPLKLEVYSPSIKFLNASDSLLRQYSNNSKLISLELRQTIIDPKLATKLHITSEHNIVASYQDRQQAIDIKAYDLVEAKISRLIHKLVKNTEPWLIFLSGHGEIEPLDNTALGLSNFSAALKAQGMHIAQLDLAAQQQIPHNTSAILVVNPQTDLSATEKQLLHAYLQQGGQMLWFTEPGATANSWLTEEFGLELAPGIVIDPTSTARGSPHPALKIVPMPQPHMLVQDLTSAIVLPWSGHLQVTNPDSKNWQANSFLNTDAQTWSYIGSAVSEDLAVLQQHKGQSGPLDIGVALTSTAANNKAAHVIVMADSSFMINKYFGLYANAQLANNIISWTLNEAKAYNFEHRSVTDLSYQPQRLDQFIYRFGFTLIVPLLLIARGIYTQRQRVLAERAN